jgi:transposase
VPFYRRMRRKYGKSVVVQEDNAPWHTTKVVKKFWADLGIPKLDWPAQSPDLSPIENLWKYIKDIISKKRHKIKSIKDIEDALIELWPKIDPNFLTKLNDSMPRRLDTCIRNIGGATKY